MPYTLTTQDVESFRSDGAVLLPQLINQTWIERLRQAVARDMASPGPYFHGYQIEGSGRFHGNLRLWESDTDFRDYCHDSVLPEVAAQLLDVDTIRLYYDQLFVKEAAANAPTRWHNDQPYWPIRGWPIMSFWLALDPVDAENGALEFIQASHHWDTWYQPEPFAPGSDAGYEQNGDYVAMPDIDARRSEYRFLSWDMQPGDVIAFHALTVHGGPANKSQQQRRGYTVRYCGPDMTYYTGPGTAPALHDESLKQGDLIQGERYPLVFKR